MNDVRNKQAYFDFYEDKIFAEEEDLEVCNNMLLSIKPKSFNNVQNYIVALMKSC